MRINGNEQLSLICFSLKQPFAIIIQFSWRYAILWDGYCHHDNIYILVFSFLQDEPRTNLLQNIKQNDYEKTVEQVK